MGREEGIPVVPPRFPALTVQARGTLFALTNISLPGNAGIADRTTKRVTFFTFTAREGTSTDFGRVQLSASLWELHISGGFCQSTFLCHSLYLINVIIPKIIPVSSPDCSRSMEFSGSGLRGFPWG
jgi:hypothetical protein